jgi:hypothetical protein
MRRVEAFGQELKKHLMSMGEPRSGLRPFGHQIIRGSNDEAQLASIMASLGRAKQDLILQVQVANVGLTKSVNNAILIEVATVNKIQALLEDTLGEGKGLRILISSENKGQFWKVITVKATPLKKTWLTVQTGDVPVPLSIADYEELQTEELKALHPELAEATLNEGGKRIVIHNLTEIKPFKSMGRSRSICGRMWLSSKSRGM